MASRIVTRHYDRALAPVELSTNAYSILARICEEGPLPLGELAGRLAMDRTTLSRETAPLIAAGLLRAAPDAHDRRRRVLELSAAGLERLGRARPLWARAQGSLTEDFGLARSNGLLAELHALLGATA